MTLPEQNSPRADAGPNLTAEVAPGDASTGLQATWRRCVKPTWIIYRGVVARKLSRIAGRRADPVVELFVAFDDPQSAVALLALDRELVGKRARLQVAPVIRRGIPNDPATELKRRYAIVDAARRAESLGLGRLRREHPLPADEAATWAKAAVATPMAVAVMKHLWFGDAAPALPEAQTDPRSSEDRMRDLGMYDTPSAYVHGEWFFAHERIEQIRDRVTTLGWQ